LGGSECVCLDSRTWTPVKTLRDSRSNGGFYYLTWPQFTSDGRYLLLQSSRPELEIFATANWQRVVRLPEVPPDSLQYLPSPDNKRALAGLKSGSVMLWNIPRRRVIAPLDDNAHLWQVSFSPDGSLVAAATTQIAGSESHTSPPRLRIWKTADGKLVHELVPDGQATPYPIEHIAWSPDGQQHQRVQCEERASAG
jgi:WD40 repeat protein